MNVERLANALAIVAGTDATVFVWGLGEEPEGDLWIGSDEFARLVLAVYDRLEKGQAA